jgi:hypothetical protein
VPTTLLEDFDSQDRIGIRRGEFTNNAWSTTATTDAVAAEILALYGTARLVASTVTVRCYGADDPNLPVMLDLDPADVVIVTVPRAPAADMDLSCLVTQVAAQTDGLVTEFTLTLSPCPVPAQLDERVFLGLDTDGIPYIDPIRKPDAWHISLGGDGYYYLDPAGGDDAAVDDTGVVYVRSGA